MTSSGGVSVVDIAVLVLIVLAVFDWACFLLLHRAGNRAKKELGRRVRTLDERKQAAFLVGLSCSFYVTLGVLRWFFGPLPPEIGLSLLVAGATTASLASVNWFVSLLRGAFRSEPQEHVQDAILLLDSLGYRIEAPASS